LKVASGHCIFSHVRSRQDDLSIRGDNLGCRTLSTQPALMTLDFDDASLFTTCRYGLKFIFNCRERGTKENAVKAYEYHSRNWVTIVQHHRSKADIAHDAQTFDDVQLTLIRLDDKIGCLVPRLSIQYMHPRRCQPLSCIYRIVSPFIHTKVESSTSSMCPVMENRDVYSTCRWRFVNG
jgi:hypothetical protein